MTNFIFVTRSFKDPAFTIAQDVITKIEEIAWDNYSDSHKAPLTAKAGPEFADPDYALSIEWYATHEKLLAAEARQKDSSTPSRVLLICGSTRNDSSCPGEISKAFRLTQLA